MNKLRKLKKTQKMNKLRKLKQKLKIYIYKEKNLDK